MNQDKPCFILDSYALLAFLNREPGGERVQTTFSQAMASQVQVLLCLINLGEVLYIVERRHGLPTAQYILALVESLPIHLVEASRNLVLDAAHIKAHFPISYADAFVAALAQQEKAVILTGDPEFKAITALCQVEWLR